MDVFGLSAGVWFEVLTVLLLVFGMALTFMGVFTETQFNWELIGILFGIFLVFLVYMDVIQRMYAALGIIIICLTVASVYRSKL